MMVEPLPDEGAKGLRGGPAHRIALDRHEIVGAVMEWQAFLWEAIESNGIAIRPLAQREAGGPTSLALAALHRTHQVLWDAYQDIKVASGELDGVAEA